MTSKGERLLATLMYVSSFFTMFLGPLIIWLIKKDDSSFVDYHGKEYLNFLISYGIYASISIVYMAILIGVVMMGVVGTLALIFTIMAAIQAYKGDEFRIPLVFRLIP